MTSTNKTINIELSQFEGSDSFTREGYNSDMLKIDTEMGNVKTDLTRVDNVSQKLDTKVNTESKITSERSVKDAEGLFTIVTYKRSDNTVYKTSMLSGGTSSQYTTRTVKWFDTDGTTILATDVYTLTYDADGDLLSEVLQ